MANIFVIAGHGAGDPGATGNGYTEAERVRALAGRIKALGGSAVTLGDTSRDWYADGGINSLHIPKDTQIIELHMDAGGILARGGHVIIKAGYSPDEYDSALASFLKGILPGRADMIVGRDNLANVNRAAARGFGYRLVEFGFITNAVDVKIFNSRMDDIARGVLASFGISAEPTNHQTPGNPVNNGQLYYRSHVQTYGTLDPVRDGQTSGTTGKAKRLEGLYIDLRTVRKSYPGAKMKAKAHIQDIGWKEYASVEHDTLIGTKGEGRRLEALELDISGVAGKTLYYRTHLAGSGWTTWVKGGFATGSVGIEKGIEAIQIKLV